MVSNKNDLMKVGSHFEAHKTS